MSFLRTYIFIILTALGSIFLIFQFFIYGPPALSGVMDTTFKDAGYDFHSLYFGGKRMVIGDNLYYAEKQEYKNVHEIPGIFVYPPLMAAFFAPLSYIPLQQSFLFFDFLSLVIFFVLLYRLSSKDFLNNPWFIVLSIAVFLLSPVLLLHLERGQTDILVMSMVYLSLAAFQKNKSVFSGFWIGIAASLKVTSLIFLPYFFLKDKNAFWSSVVTIILSSLFFKFDIWFDFFKKFGTFVSNYSSGIVSNSLFGVFRNHYTESYFSESSLHLVYLFVVAVILFAVFIFFYLSRGSRKYQLYEYGILTSLIIIIPSVAWIYNGVYSIFILASYWSIRSRNDLNKLLYFIFDIFAYILLAQPIMYSHLRDFGIYHIFSIRPLLYLCFITLLIYVMLKEYLKENDIRFLLKSNSSL